MSPAATRPAATTRSPLPALLALGLLTGACQAPADAPEPAEASPADVSAPVDAPPPAEAAGPVEIPDALLGTFDATAEACAERVTMARLGVAPDTLRFYYGYATVDSVSAAPDGVEVAATLYQLEGAVEVVPEPATYRLSPTDGGLRFGNEFQRDGPQALVRCPETAD